VCPIKIHEFPWKSSIFQTKYTLILAPAASSEWLLAGPAEVELLQGIGKLHGIDETSGVWIHGLEDIVSTSWGLMLESALDTLWLSQSSYIFEWIYPLKMVIFHSYASLPEGIASNPPISQRFLGNSVVAAMRITEKSWFGIPKPQKLHARCQTSVWPRPAALFQHRSYRTWGFNQPRGVWIFWAPTGNTIWLWLTVCHGKIHHF